MTQYDVLKYAEQYLAECGISDSVTDAWLLFAYVTGVNRTRFLLERGQEMPQEQYERYQALLEQRGSHIPLQHLTGVQEFMGLLFRVNQDVLIPRQDTEVLVEEALNHIRENMRILDLCTGSGCIAVSLAKLCRKPGVQVEASDLSEKALKVALENVQNNQAKVKLIHSDLLESIEGTFDMIVSNPPYIRTEVIRELSEEVKDHEPYMALDGRADGLYFYREIIRKSRDHLNPGGMILFEIGYDQGESVQALLKEAGFQNTKVIKDLAGLDRVVTGKIQEGSHV